MYEEVLLAQHGPRNLRRALVEFATHRFNLSVRRGALSTDLLDQRAAAELPLLPHITARKGQRTPLT